MYAGIQIFLTNGVLVINFIPREPPKMNFVSQWERELTRSQKSLAAKLIFHFFITFFMQIMSKLHCLSLGYLQKS